MGVVTRLLAVTIATVAAVSAPAQSGIFDKLFGKKAPSEEKVAAALKEALVIGAGNAVGSTGTLDGFFKNEAIKILMPEKLQKVESLLRALGLGPEIDAFVLSMNRAAERAVPAAKPILKSALDQMTFADARQILRGGDTAATDYFRAKTSEQMTAAFLPVVSSALNEVGATQRYKELAGRLSALPFVSSESLDLDRFVTGKALDGLFRVLGDEERKIRHDPAARVTKLLKEVFTSSTR